MNHQIHSESHLGRGAQTLRTLLRRTSSSGACVREFTFYASLYNTACILQRISQHLFICTPVRTACIALGTILSRRTLGYIVSLCVADLPLSLAMPPKNNVTPLRQAGALEEEPGSYRARLQSNKEHIRGPRRITLRVRMLLNYRASSCKPLHDKSCTC